MIPTQPPSAYSIFCAHLHYGMAGRPAMHASGVPSRFMTSLKSWIRLPASYKSRANNCTPRPGVFGRLIWLPPTCGIVGQPAGYHLSRSPAFLGRRPASTCAEAAIPMPPQDNAGSRCTRLQDAMADGEGFEPPRPLRAFRFSRPAPSTTRPPIRLVLPGPCA